jgi:hypothetical protein
MAKLKDEISALRGRNIAKTHESGLGAFKEYLAMDTQVAEEVTARNSGRSAAAFDNFR